MVRRHGTAQTKTNGVLIIFIGTIFFVGLIGYIAWNILLSRNSSIPYTIAMIGNPIVVLSWDQSSQKARLLTLSPDVTVTGMYQTGKYSLTSLWKLGIIDKQDAKLFVMSLEEALGFPIPYYLGQEEIPTQFDSPAATVKRTFSLQNISSYIRGNYKTNIDFVTFLRFMTIVSKFDATNMVVRAADASQVTIEEQVPDGSRVFLLAENRLDAQLAHFFEFDSIRQESLRVAVYNTTQTPTLGARFGRMLSTIGANIVFVGNEPDHIADCIIEGTKEHLDSHTGTFIQRYFHCKRVENIELTREDLVVKVGKIYEEKFLPRSRQ